ncbi:MAG TPA: type II CAAX endopeptidase family protein [Candidatus Angelobacter sp.]|nr:type II CAAX endopeptidase family protein [Candidatus Angelobacter sp.]
METEASPSGPPRLLNIALFNDRGLRAGWRLLIYIGILLVFRLVAVSLLAHFFGKSGPLAITEMTPGFTIFGDGAVFLLLLLAAFIMSRVERRSMAEYGLPLKGQPVLSRFVAGYIVWGFLPLTIVLLIMRLLHGFSFGQLTLHGGQIAIFGLEWAVAFVLVGLAEEYMLRGYSLYTLADGIGFWPAAIFMAALFGLGHAGNPGESRIGLIGTVVFALFASLTLRLTGNLWLAIGAHAGWDWGQSFFYGVSDSGLTARGHLFQPSFHGPDWLTGGSVGPEGSIVTLVLWSLMIVLFALVYRRRRPALVVTAQRI